MGGHHHAIENISSRMVPARALTAESPMPFYLAAGARLVRPVAKNTPIRLGDVEIDPKSELSVLRRQQDKSFFPGQ
ncbi:hypothetical protein D3C86_2180910 [compost metagenome]